MATKEKTYYINYNVERLNANKGFTLVYDAKHKKLYKNEKDRQLSNNSLASGIDCIISFLDGIYFTL